MKAASGKSLLLIIFAVGGLVGPVIQWSTWPPSKFAMSASKWTVTFVSDLVFLLWPTQMVSVIESTLGLTAATALALGANILLFALLGLTVSMFVSHVRGFVLAYTVVAALIILLALWGAGFSIAYLSPMALVVALLIYAAPFYIASRVVSQSS